MNNTNAVDMTDAYRKVLGLDQSPLQEAQKEEDDKEESGEQIEVCEKCDKVHEGTCTSEQLSPKQKKIDHDKDGDIDGKDLAKLRGESYDQDTLEFIATLAESGFDQDEIDSIVAKLDEKHVGTQGPDAAPAAELGDNLSDGELNFLDKHEVEVTDATPEDPEHAVGIKQATAPTTKGIGTAEVDGKKLVAGKPEVAVKSKAKVGK